MTTPPRPLLPRLACIVVLLAARCAIVTPSTASASEDRWLWPVQPPDVVTTFDPPDTPYGAGHRGVDLAGVVGQPVTAVADGTVVFAGPLAGRGVISIQHESGLRSTYEPVVARVHAGQHVTQGQVVGSLALTGSHCLPSPCLHLGARDGGVYLDPLSLLGAPEVRLKPLDGYDVPTAENPGAPAVPVTDLHTVAWSSPVPA